MFMITVICLILSFLLFKYIKRSYFSESLILTTATNYIKTVVELRMFLIEQHDLGKFQLSDDDYKWLYFTSRHQLADLELSLLNKVWSLSHKEKLDSIGTNMITIISKLTLS